ncbi:undecaprenyl/decaprenyl-phosphate alpha-N-acetylglucosaminyl 1-phosphate transferase [Patescibacteria group bacterium]|nr:undecaprenyl/decaprenyl-phosphate alpha-N-acetylglucosaminyl 1-phosphate transferase [Patescibacteria group bacterium]
MLLNKLNLPSDFILPAIVSFLVTLLFIPIVIKLSKKFKLTDSPQRDHPAILHQKPIARGGGIPLFLGFATAVFLFFPLTPAIKAILVGSLVNIIFGTLDDRFNLSPWLRLFITLPLAALPIIFCGIELTMSNPLGGGIISFRWWEIPLPLTSASIFLPEAALLVFWVVWVSNMVNWTKGASQLPGLAVIAFATLAGVALKYQSGNPQQLITARLGITLAAASLALLPFNFPPEKIFPGFGGSTFIGFNLAVLAILSGGKVAAALLVLGIPAADMLITIWRRFKFHKNPLHGDREHFYHLLLNLGLTKRQVILLYWFVTLCLGIFALQLERSQKLFAIVLVFVLTTGSFIIIRWLLRRKEVLCL